MKLCTLAALSVIGCAAAPGPTPNAATHATVAVPAFDPKTEELAPVGDYRSWVFLTSGYQMGYGPAAVAARANGIGAYDTVFVEPAAHAAFQKTGVWPDRTLFVLEIRASEHTGSIVTTGYFQTDVIGLEAEIKDARIPGGWGYFDLGNGQGPSKRIPPEASCYECHSQNAAVEHTFTQFYPTLLPIAKAHGTVRKDFVGIPASVQEIYQTIVTRGFPAARTAIDEVAAKWPDATIAREASLNSLGYRLVQDKRVDAAIEVFQDITRRWPESPNAWDSLAETLEGAGKLGDARDANSHGLAVIEKMDAGDRRDRIERALRERATRLAAK